MKITQEQLNKLRAVGYSGEDSLEEVLKTLFNVSSTYFDGAEIPEEVWWVKLKDLALKKNRNLDEEAVSLLERKLRGGN